MVICPNCNHSNPDGAVQCEACYTPLKVAEASPVTAKHCPSCGAEVQANAMFCGQCGFNLKDNASPSFPDSHEIPETLIPELMGDDDEEFVSEDETEVTIQMMPTIATGGQKAPATATENNVTAIQAEPKITLMHVQTNIPIDIPNGLDVVHIGKPNDVVPPDIDVSGFPHSEVVSRVHADLRIESGLYYIEDTGSSNGTYVNHAPLPAGNRHRLREGDRIALGKGDKVTFLFQING